MRQSLCRPTRAEPWQALLCCAGSVVAPALPRPARCVLCAVCTSAGLSTCPHCSPHRRCCGHGRWRRTCPVTRLVGPQEDSALRAVAVQPPATERAQQRVRQVRPVGRLPARVGVKG